MCIRDRVNAARCWAEHRSCHCPEMALVLLRDLGEHSFLRQRSVDKDDTAIRVMTYPGAPVRGSDDVDFDGLFHRKRIGPPAMCA